MKLLSGRGVLALPIAAAFVAPLLLAPRTAVAQDNIVVYKGDSKETSGITVAPWGSGVVTTDTQTHLPEEIGRAHV